MRKNKIYPILFTFLLTSFTGYVLLDTFVISEVYEKVEDTSQNESSNEISIGQTTIDNDTYIDDNISIKLNTIRKYDTTIYIADIYINDANYLKTAFANSSYGKNITATTSETAKNNNAILAINGDYYGVQNNGYVLKNYKLYRSTSVSNKQDLVIYGDGSFEVINESEVTAEQLVKKGAKEILSFGPALIVNGQIVVSENEEVGKAMASNPRTAIGIIDKNHYVFVVSDGRTSESVGLSLYELASVMKEIGIQTLYNLDGGGSSAMYFNGNLINKPTTNGRSIKEREVSDIVYIGY